MYGNLLVRSGGGVGFCLYRAYVSYIFWSDVCEMRVRRYIFDALFGLIVLYIVFCLKFIENWLECCCCFEYRLDV